MSEQTGARTVLLVGGDLMARARLEQAASAANLGIVVTGAGHLVNALRGTAPEVVVLDLDTGGAQLVAELEAARAAGLVRGRVVGYFSHIDEALGVTARGAGCEAFPRGRFWRTLPEILGGQGPTSP
jgi:hypothetical protein